MAVSGWTPFLAVQDRSAPAQNPGYPAGVALPPTVLQVEARLDVTTGVPATPFQGIAHPFNDPAMRIDWHVDFSYDNQATWLPALGSSEQGNVAGNWGKNQMAPYASADFNPASGKARPTHYRYSIAPHQLTTFGGSIQTTT